MNEQDTANDPIEFIGIVYRFGALLIDSLLVAAVYAPLAYLLFGQNPLANADARAAGAALALIVVVAYVFGWWVFAGTSPGKWFCSARIVDFATGRRPHAGRMLLRLLAAMLSAVPLLLGFWWAARDPYKRAWHDHLARTAVIGDESLRPPTPAEQAGAHYCVQSAPWA